MTGITAGNSGFKAETAVYQKQSALELIGNPFAEALPQLLDPDTVAARLLVQPPYLPGDRNLPKQERLFRLTRIKNIHIPNRNDVEIAMNIDRCIHWSYYTQNPMPRETVYTAIREAGIVLDEAAVRYLESFKAPFAGFPVYGVSGVGKTCSVVNVLTMFPQIIRHESYRGQPFQTVQVVWLKVDCPSDGSQKGLCIAIIEELDKLLGTDYTSQYVRGRASKDYLVVAVGRLVRMYHVGVIVCDEIQNLCGVKESVSRELLNFLVHLINTVGIPVVMVGSPRILTILQSEFQQAKRATGEGEIKMDLMARNSSDWNRFIKAIWHYQYTQVDVKLTEAMKNVFYEESVGNPFIASVLYKLVQDNTILLEGTRESKAAGFTVADVRKVAKTKLAMTAAKRRAMLNGEDVELNQYMYLWNAATVDLAGAAAVPEEKEKKADVLKKGIDLQRELEQRIMQAADLDIREVRRYVREACAAYPSETNLMTLTGYCLTLIGNAQNSTNDNRKLADDTGYDAAKRNGYVSDVSSGT